MRGMEGMRHKEAEMKVLGFSQGNFNKLKGFCAGENKTFCFICRFFKIHFKKSLANPLSCAGGKLSSPVGTSSFLGLFLELLSVCEHTDMLNLITVALQRYFNLKC